MVSALARIRGSEYERRATRDSRMQRRASCGPESGFQTDLGDSRGSRGPRDWSAGSRGAVRVKVTLESETVNSWSRMS
ncbi:hypothetical protein WN48_02654 [Eufriesea mexicana]|uniref:Uncharacterized protein n=1 Tax=Eufriesea mexicana TaxID=516756 RepID=A0A310SBQ3_9HYME|nr:hypothetical protein WN48_02654 [Eufriesea mexicana]